MILYYLLLGTVTVAVVATAPIWIPLVILGAVVAFLKDVLFDD